LSEASSPKLEKFVDEWKRHHPLQLAQPAFADAVAEVVDVAYYHGGNELYALDGIPGLWHEGRLRRAAV